jgi:hypothetical protein
MSLKQSVVGIVMAGSFVVAGLLMPSDGIAQDAKVKAAMEILRSMADKIGPPMRDRNPSRSQRKSDRVHPEK